MIAGVVTPNQESRTKEHAAPSGQSRIGVVLCSVYVILLAALLTVYFAPVPLTHFAKSDSGVFLYIGQRIADGATPYRDAWDHKPPLVFYVNALGLVLAGGSAWGVWALGSLGVTAAIWMLLATFRRSFGTVPALLGAVGFAAAAIWTLEYLNVTEVYALPLEAFIFYTFIKTDRARGYIAAGFATALLFLLRQNLIGAGLAAAVCIPVLHRGGSPWPVVKRWAQMLLGFTIPVATVVVYFALRGTLHEMYAAAFLFNVEYSATTWHTRLASLLPGINATAGAGALLLALAAIGFAVLSRLEHQPVAVRSVVILALADLALEVPLAAISGRGYAHYFSPWAPPLACLVAYLGYAVSHFSTGDVFGTKARRISAGVLLATSLFLVENAALLRAVLQKSAWRPNDPARENVAALMKEHTAATDRVFVWGYGPELYLMSGRYAPSRYFMQTALAQRKFSDRAMIAEITGSLDEGKPRLIIDSAYALNPGFPPLDLEGRQTWERTHTRAPELSPLFALIDREYVRVSAPGIGQWVVYARKEDIPSSASKPAASGAGLLRVDGLPRRGTPSPYPNAASEEK
jgi:hypothetical protein